MEGEDTTTPFGSGVDNPGMDDGDETELEPYDSSSRRGSKDAGRPSLVSTSLHKTHEETSFMGDIDGHAPLIQRESSRGEESLRSEESKVNEAWRRIHEKFPRADTSKFTATLDEGGKVSVSLIRSNKKPHPLFRDNGELNVRGKDRVPKTLLESLGPTAEEIAAANEEEIASRSAKVKELRSALETAGENQRESINRQINDLENEIDGLERENEAIEQRMSLRDRIKAIFKKYGFTLIGVLAAVGTVIGVIVSNLKQGLTTLGKGVGGALKSIGKKLGEILPGLVVAIASFVLKTAGEVIGFLGKNAWLLIVGVVVFLIERLKKNSR